MTELETWFLSWWADLPTYHFTSKNKGSKAECWKEVQKLKPDAELRKHIDWYTRELALRTAKLKRTDMRVPGWRHGVRLIRYRFWDDDLPTVAGEREKQEGAKCSCGKPVEIKTQCWSCHGWPDRFKEERRIALERIGLAVPGRDSTPTELAKWRQDCREWCRANADRVLGKTIGGRA